MGKRKEKILELEIENLAFGGRGIAKLDGFVVFVEGAVPGDFVRAKIVKRKKQFAEAVVIEILRPSQKRIDPECKYFGTCGGCRWQSLDYKDQLEYKTSQVKEAFKHIGLIDSVEVLDALGSPQIFRYRNKMEFSFTDSGWLTPEQLEDKNIIKGSGVGLHVPGVFSKIIDIDKCLIQPEQGDIILDTVRKFMLSSEHKVYDGRKHEGFWRFLMIRHSVAENSFMVNIVTGYENRDEIEALGEELKKNCPYVTSFLNNVSSKKASISQGDYELLIFGDNQITEKIGDHSFSISANSFFQTNTKGAEQLYNVVKEFADLKGDEYVADLYTGTGSIAIHLSGYANEIFGVEIVEEAIKDARKNCEVNNITNCSFSAGDLKDVIQDMNRRPDVLVCDPPRAGMHKTVVEKILELAPEKIVYVSCNPATMARDISMFKEKYDPVRVQPVDMFPHTYHIEAVAELVLRSF
jgi:23S rRNA (uracil1939-C5)-methyltransferase